MTIGIIGGGPAGCYLGSKIDWDNAVVFERKSEIGRPIQCTGILTSSIKKIIDLPENTVKNEIKNFNIISPDRNNLQIKLKKNDIVIDREKFDKHIAKLCIENRTPILLNHDLKGWKIKNNPLKKGKCFHLSFKNGKTFDVDYLVGADGPYSTVAKQSKTQIKDILVGYQAKVKGKFDEETTQIYLGKGDFAWLVPEDSKTARIGLVGPQKQSQILYKEYKELIKPYKFLEAQSGPIPLYDQDQTIQRGHLALLGDSAGQVKATTYGGIIYGLKAAECLAKEWDNYQYRINKQIKRDLWISLKIREVLNRFSDKDFNDIINIFNKEKNKSILEKSDRNYPSTFILKLLLREPKLWKYSLKLFA